MRHPEPKVIPRPVVTLVVLVSLAILAADVFGQLVIPGHTANPLIDAPLIALIAAVITGAKGPKPDAPTASALPTPTAPQPSITPQPVGRHHHREGQP